MFKLKSLSMFKNINDKKCFIVRSPVSLKRDCESMLNAIGNVIEIDGIMYNVKSFDLYSTNINVSIGEKIGILVE